MQRKQRSFWSKGYFKQARRWIFHRHNGAERAIRHNWKYVDIVR